MYLYYDKNLSLRTKIDHGEKIRQGSDFNVFVCLDEDFPFETDNYCISATIKYKDNVVGIHHISEEGKQLIEFQKLYPNENTSDFVEGQVYWTYQFKFSAKPYTQNAGNIVLNLSIDYLGEDNETLGIVRTFGSAELFVEKTVGYGKQNVPVSNENYSKIIEQINKIEAKKLDKTEIPQSEIKTIDGKPVLVSKEIIDLINEKDFNNAFNQLNKIINDISNKKSIISVDVVEAKNENLTDVSNTIWRFKNNIDLSYLKNNNININFKSNNLIFNSIQYYNSNDSLIGMKYDNKVVFNVQEASISWLSDKYQMINIFDGFDTKNASFINWLSENAEFFDFIEKDFVTYKLNKVGNSIQLIGSDGSITSVTDSVGGSVDVSDLNNSVSNLANEVSTIKLKITNIETKTEKIDNLEQNVQDITNSYLDKNDAENTYATITRVDELSQKIDDFVSGGTGSGGEVQLTNYFTKTESDDRYADKKTVSDIASRVKSVEDNVGPKYEELVNKVGNNETKITEIENQLVMVDDHLNSESTNAIQNKVVTKKINEIDDKVTTMEDDFQNFEDEVAQKYDELYNNVHDEVDELKTKVRAFELVLDEPVDLTNSIWVLNDELNIEFSKTFNVTIQTYQNYFYSNLTLNKDEKALYYEDTKVYDGTISVPWDDSDYKTVVIHGGDDVKNAELFVWLKENAKQTTSNKDYYTKIESDDRYVAQTTLADYYTISQSKAEFLSKTTAASTYVKTETVNIINKRLQALESYSETGSSTIVTLENTIWKLDDTLTALQAITLNLNFSSKLIEQGFTAEEKFQQIIIEDSGSNNYIVKFKKDDGELIPVYQDESWYDESYKIIKITGGNDVANTSVINFMGILGSIQLSGKYSNLVFKGVADSTTGEKFSLSSIFNRNLGGSLLFNCYIDDNSMLYHQVIIPVRNVELLKTLNSEYGNIKCDEAQISIYSENAAEFLNYKLRFNEDDTFTVHRKDFVVYEVYHIH